MADPHDAPLQAGRQARAWTWQRVLLGLAGAALLAGISGLGATALFQTPPQTAADCGIPPCVLAPLPPAEVVMRIPPGSLPDVTLPDVTPPVGPPVGSPAGPPVGPAAPLPDQGTGAVSEPAPLALDPGLMMQPAPALPPLAQVEVAKRPEPKKPRDILLPGEVMKPERQNAAPVMGANKPRTAARPPPPPPLKPLRPAEKTSPRPYTVTTTRPSGAVGIRLGPCGPTVPRYQVDGVEVDAFGRPCGPS